jgi:hypothetical protein
MLRVLERVEQRGGQRLGARERGVDVRARLELPRGELARHAAQGVEACHDQTADEVRHRGGHAKRLYRAGRDCRLSIRSRAAPRVA